MLDIRPRSPRLRYENVPRHWLGGSAVATQLGNALHALFPSGELFLIRAAQPFLPQIRFRDPRLFAQVRGFFAQEGRHRVEHERFLAVLRDQGYAVDRFRAAFERVAFGMIEPRASPRLRLATAVAFEHIFASVAAAALESGGLEREVPSGVRELLQWHAAEEIEHKAVLFDLLARIDGRRSLRLAGLGCALSIYLAFVVGATAWFLAQDPEATAAKILRDLRRGPTCGVVSLAALLRAAREYLAADFDPRSRTDDVARASAFLEALA